MKIMLDDYGIMPTRAHKTDAGLDIYSPVEITIAPGSSGIIRTGVHVELPPGCAGMLVSKSGLNVKHDITSEGLIDEGYTGEIIVKLYNNGSTYFFVGKGMKVSQLVVVPVLYPDLEQVEKLEETERGAGGFGSTGV